MDSQQTYDALAEAQGAIQRAMELCVQNGAVKRRVRARRARRPTTRKPTDFNRFVKFKIGELKAAGGAPRKSTDLLKEAAHAWTNRSAEDLAEWRAAEAAAEAAHESVGSTEN